MGEFMLALLLGTTLDNEHLHSQVKEIMEPYRNKMAVKECGCVGAEAVKAARNTSASRVGGDYGYLKKRWNEIIGSRPPFSEYMVVWKAIYNDTLNNHPLFEKPSPNCPECNGSGIFREKENPSGRFESCHLVSTTEGPVELIDKLVEMDKYIIKAGDITPKNVPVVIITPDGKWKSEYDDYEQPISEEWVIKALAIFKEYSECWAVYCQMSF